MTAIAIKKKLVDYINRADDKKVKAIYTLVEKEIEEKSDHWNDASFVAELDKRVNDYVSGKSKSFSWEEAKVKLAKKKKA